MKTFIHIVFTLALTLCVFGCDSHAQTPDTVKLPDPDRVGGLPLMQTIAKRSSHRFYTDSELEPQVLSNLLWATGGVNREDGRRTYPSAKNRQEIDVYVMMKSGVYRYDAASHALIGVLKEDIRPIATKQPFGAKAPVLLLYVGDNTKSPFADPIEQRLRVFQCAAYLGQNAALYCASAGLANCYLMLINREPIAEKLKLPETLSVVDCQSVGYPAPATPRAPRGERKGTGKEGAHGHDHSHGHGDHGHSH